MVVIVTAGDTSPAARTRAEMAADVANFVLMPDDTEVASRANDAINDAIRYLNTRNWNWSLIYQDITLVADTSEYDLNNAWRAPRMAELLDSGSKAKGRLSWFTPREFIDAFPDRSTSGDPAAYTVFDEQDRGKVTLSCPCASAFISIYPTLRLWHYRRCQYLTSDSDTIEEAPSEVTGFVVWHARMIIASMYDKASVALAKTMRDEAWRLLVRDDVAGQLTDWA